MSFSFLSHRFLFRCLCLVTALSASPASAQNGEQPSSTVTTADNDAATSATTTVDFASALLVAASVAPEIALANISNPIPLPPDVADIDELHQLAERWPPLQETVLVAEDLDVATSGMSPSGNETNRPERRQGSRRILIVGDSMTHCNEGDYTWRYRLWQWFQAQSISVDFVGPYEGTVQPDEPAPPAPPPLYRAPSPQPPLRVSGGYAAPFDRYLAVQLNNGRLLSITVHISRYRGVPLLSYSMYQLR